MLIYRTFIRLEWSGQIATGLLQEQLSCIHNLPKHNILSYILFSTFYTYYETYWEKGDFLVWKLKSGDTLHASSDIKLFSEFYEFKLTLKKAVK